MRKRRLWVYIIVRSLFLFGLAVIFCILLLSTRQHLCLLASNAASSLTTLTPSINVRQLTTSPTLSSTNDVEVPNELTSLEKADAIVSMLQRWRDPSYVHRRLRIYVYDLPDHYNVGLVRDSHTNPPKIRDPYCDQSFYSAEHAFHQYLLHSPVRTANPEEADLYYVPIYATCYLLTHLPNNVNSTGTFFSEGMRKHVVEKYPYWKRSQGRDHVFMFTQGFAARLSGSPTGDWKNAIFLVHNGEMTASEYTPHKDVTIPPHLKYYFDPVWREEKDEGEGENVLPVKKNFIQFGGQVISLNVSDHRGSNYSGGVRQYVKEHMLGKPGYRITGVREKTYTKDMSESVFCLSPEGWHPWSPRPYYAVLRGCVPVVISERQELAFEDIVNWDDFAVWVKPKEIARMDKALRKMKAREIENRLQAMQKIWKLFWYGEEGLANEAIVYELYRRKYISKPRRTFIR